MKLLKLFKRENQLCFCYALIFFLMFLVFRANAFLWQNNSNSTQTVSRAKYDVILKENRKLRNIVNQFYDFEAMLKKNNPQEIKYKIDRDREFRLKGDTIVILKKGDYKLMELDNE